jgi:hypothetical protein
LWVKSVLLDPMNQAGSGFSLAHVAIVAVLALGAGAGTAWLLTDGATRPPPPRVVERTARPAAPPAPATAPAAIQAPAAVTPPPRTAPIANAPVVAAPILAAPDTITVAAPLPVPRRELALAPAAAPIPVPPPAAASPPVPPPAASVQLPPPAASAAVPDRIPRGTGASSPSFDDERALAPAPSPAMAPPPAPSPAEQSPARVGDCERYTTQLVIDGRRIQRNGTACLQPDGTWRMKGDN